MSKKIKFDLAAARAAIRNVATTLAAYQEAIEPLMKMSITYKQWESLRKDFTEAYQKSRPDVSAAAARQAWSRLSRNAGMVKPASDSAEAVKKRSQRKAAKGVDTATTAAKAKMIKTELNALEAHLISLLRRGQYAAMVEIIQSEAAKANP